jgi:hypothetical protein
LFKGGRCSQKWREDELLAYPKHTQIIIIGGKKRRYMIHNGKTIGTQNCEDMINGS